MARETRQGAESRAGRAARARWDARYRAATPALFGDAPAPLLVEVARRLPRRGRALDLAMGEGQNATWLARRGLEVEGFDISPVAVERARARAQALGVRLRARTADLAQHHLARGRYDLITCFHFLERRLIPEIAAALRPGGLVLIEIATLRNLALHARPRRAYLLEEGELRGWFPRLETLLYREGIMGDHAQAQLLARRPPKA